MSRPRRDSGTQPAFVATPGVDGEREVRVDVTATWLKARRILREYVDILGLDYVCEGMGPRATPAWVLNALSETDRNTPGKLIVFLLANAPDDRLARLLAATSGGTWEKRRKRTEAECWQVAKERLERRFGPAGRDVIDEIEGE